jgi:hypothetical protein
VNIPQIGTGYLASRRILPDSPTVETNMFVLEVKSRGEFEMSQCAVHLFLQGPVVFIDRRRTSSRSSHSRATNAGQHGFDDFLAQHEATREGTAGRFTHAIACEFCRRVAPVLSS